MAKNIKFMTILKIGILVDALFAGSRIIEATEKAQFEERYFTYDWEDLAATNGLGNLFLPVISKPPITSGSYQETDSIIVLEGEWTFAQDSRASAGGYAVSNNPEGTVSFTFAGDSLVLYRKVNTETVLEQTCLRTY